MTMLPRFISHPSDLITLHEETRKGFLNQALAKTEQAKTYIDDAIEFNKILQQVSSIEQLLRIDTIRYNLIAAAGFSDKARNKLTRDELDQSIFEVLNRIFLQAGPNFREEILYRYLLTKGDSLGGKMRNIAGSNAGKQITRAIINELDIKSYNHDIKQNKTSNKIQSISWKQRTILFDHKPPFFTNNIDMALVNINIKEIKNPKTILPSQYLACGELKGGIDPAGADEHWKTARSAFDRIGLYFSNQSIDKPALFFIGAAIEKSMAEEIYQYLQTGQLSYAANLTVSKQVDDLAQWLVSL